MAQEDGSNGNDGPDNAGTGLVSEVLGAGVDALVLVTQDEVWLEIPNLGRLQMPPDVADTVGLHLRRGAAMVRAGQPKQLIKLL